MAKMMTQLDIFAKHVMGATTKSVNVVGVGGVNLEEVKFELLYNEEMNLLTKKGGAYHSYYPRPCRNNGWNRDKDMIDRDRDWCNRNSTWKEREGAKDRYVLSHERQNPNDILRVDILNICSHTLSTRLKVSIKF